MKFQTTAALFTSAAVLAQQQAPQKCLHAKERGPCRAAFVRWHYDASTSKCQKFIFGGCRGNENNFSSLQKCRESCQLASTSPSETAPPDIVTKSALQKSEKCHQAPFDMGPCRGALPRWSWNSKSGKCEQFAYGTCGGNENNFLTRARCFNTCGGQVKKGANQIEAHTEEPETTQKSSDTEEKSEKIGPTALNPGNLFGIEVEPTESEENSDDRKQPEVVCKLASQTGRCRARFDRFYFDASTGECRTFVYGGCDNNGNNFQSKRACQNFCRGQADTNEDEIEAIKPRGFEEEPEKEASTASPVESETPVKRSDRACAMKIERGPCRALYKSFGFNGKECVPFWFGGCEGNDNRFPRMDMCREACMMQRDVSGGEAEEKETTESPKVAKKLSKAERIRIKQQRRLQRLNIRRKQQAAKKNKKNKRG